MATFTIGGGQSGNISPFLSGKATPMSLPSGYVSSAMAQAANTQKALAGVGEDIGNAIVSYKKNRKRSDLIDARADSLINYFVGNPQIAAAIYPGEQLQKQVETLKGIGTQSLSKKEAIISAIQADMSMFDDNLKREESLYRRAAREYIQEPIASYKAEGERLRQKEEGIKKAMEESDPFDAEGIRALNEEAEAVKARMANLQAMGELGLVEDDERKTQAELAKTRRDIVTMEDLRDLTEELRPPTLNQQGKPPWWAGTFLDRRSSSTMPAPDFFDPSIQEAEAKRKALESQLAEPHPLAQQLLDEEAKLEAILSRSVHTPEAIQRSKDLEEAQLAMARHEWEARPDAIEASRARAADPREAAIAGMMRAGPVPTGLETLKQAEEAAARRSTAEATKATNELDLILKQQGIDINRYKLEDINAIRAVAQVGDSAITRAQRDAPGNLREAETRAEDLIRESLKGNGHTITAGVDKSIKAFVRHRLGLGPKIEAEAIPGAPGMVAMMVDGVPSGYQGDLKLGNDIDYKQRPDGMWQTTFKGQPYGAPFEIFRPPTDAPQAWAALPKEEKDRLDGIQSDMMKSSSVQAFVDTARGTMQLDLILKDALKKAEKNESVGAHDLAFIFAFMKALDPQSIVKEGEVIMARETGGKADELVVMVNKLTKGELLTPAIRDSFLNVGKISAKAAYETAKSEMMKAVVDARKRFNQFGPENWSDKYVIPYGNSPIYQLINVNPEVDVFERGTPAAAGTPAAPSGKFRWNANDKNALTPK